MERIRHRVGHDRGGANYLRAVYVGVESMSRIIIDLKCVHGGCEYVKQVDVTGRRIDKIVLLIALYLCPTHAEQTVDELYYSGLD